MRDIADIFSELSILTIGLDPGLSAVSMLSSLARRKNCWCWKGLKQLKGAEAVGRG